MRTPDSPEFLLSAGLVAVTSALGKVATADKDKNHLTKSPEISLLYPSPLPEAFYTRKYLNALKFNYKETYISYKTTNLNRTAWDINQSIIL